MDNKKKLIIGGIGVFIILLLMVILASSGKKSSTTGTDNTTGGSSNNSNSLNSTNSSGKTGGTINQGGNKTSQVPVKKLSSNSEIAKKVLEWLSKNKDSRGMYYVEITCQNGKCTQPFASPQVGMGVVWGNFKYYEKNKDNNVLNSILADIRLYSDESKVPEIQNYFWNCKLMYELWQSSVFNTEQKTNIKKICFSSQNYLPPEVNTNPKINLQDIIQKKNISIPTNETAEKFVSFSTTASDYATRFEWGKLQDDLTIAKNAFNQAAIIFNKYNTSSQLNESVLGTAAFDLYRTTKDTQYLSFAYFIFDRISKQKCNTYCTYDAFFVKELYGQLKNPKYKQFYTDTVKSLVENNFDYPGYANYKNGPGAFHPKNTVSISTYDNGIDVGLLSIDL